MGTRTTQPIVPVKNWCCNNARGPGASWQKLTAAQQGCKGQFASSDGPFAYRERNKSSSGVEHTVNYLIELCEFDLSAFRDFQF